VTRRLCARLAERVQSTVVAFSTNKLDGYIFLSGAIEADETQASRVELLLRKIHGMMTVKVVPEPATTQRMVAMLRILCDITDRAEILHFRKVYWP
jgi:hypothetical protein